MNPYELYMEKVALNAVTKRLEFRSFGRNMPRGMDFADGKIVPGKELGHSIMSDVAWKPTGQHLGELNTEYHNVTGDKFPHNPSAGPQNAASIDWIEMHNKDAIRAGLGGAMRQDVQKKLMGRGLREAYEGGMKTMTGDWKGTYTDLGARHVKGMTDMLKGRSDVSTIAAPGASAGSSKTTPSFDLDQFYQRHHADRMTDRAAKTTTAPSDILSAPRGREDQTWGQWLFGQPGSLKRKQVAPARGGFAASPYTR